MKAKILLLLVASALSFNSALACKTQTAKGLAAIESVVGEYKYDNYVSTLDSYICDRLAEYNYDAYDDMKKEEVMGIYSYTTNDIYRKLNKVLRSSKATASEKKQYAPIVKIINAGLKKLPNYKGQVVRFEKKKSISRFGVGKVKTFKAYTSSSKKKGFCWSGNVKMVIQSKTGKYIAPMSAYNSEDEVLFAPNTKFKVTKVVKVKKKSDGSLPSPNCHDEKTLNVIYMDEVK